MAAAEWGVAMRARCVPETRGSDLAARARPLSGELETTFTGIDAVLRLPYD